MGQSLRRSTIGNTFTVLVACIVSVAFAPREATAKCHGEDVFGRMQSADPSEFESLQARAASSRFRTGRFYRISRADIPPSYLFGTLHLADPRVTTLSDEVRGRLSQASVVAVESTEVTSAGVKASRESKDEQQEALLAKPEQRADRLLDRETFTALEALVADRGLPSNAARRFKPAVLALLLDQPPCAKASAKDRPYLDALIAETAAKAKIRLVGLETIAEQFNALDGLSPEVERDLLISVLRQADSGRDMIETQILRYQENDPGALLSWLMAARPLPGVGQAQTPPAFLDRLVAQRSRRMRERILPLVLRGNAFIAVGVVHLPGPDGLAQLLTNAGFSVERVE